MVVLTYASGMIVQHVYENYFFSFIKKKKTNNNTNKLYTNIFFF